MKSITTNAELRRQLNGLRQGKSVGLVPTMGALHDGHRSLIEAARRENDLVVVSIFVNPTQFGPDEDLGNYPRDRQGDLAICAAAEVDFVYMPEPEEVYPAGFATTVSVSGLTDVLCGSPESRGPGHFSGVTTVVCKLLNLVAPDRAYFGQKDAQQVAVVKRLARDLDLPTTIRVMPIIREADGLAMSSRNAYLNPLQRSQASGLYRALTAAAEALAQGEAISVALDSARAVLDQAGLEPEYLEARDPESMAPAAEFPRHPVLIALAVPVGPARLIDNILLDPGTDRGVQSQFAQHGGVPQ